MSLEDLKEMLDKHKVRKQEDAARLEALDEDECMACGAYGEDKRSLNIECFYDLKEFIPEMIEHPDGGFYLRICKACRGEFMDYLQTWWKDVIRKRGSIMDSDGNIGPLSPEHNIPVRVNGAIRYVTEKEWYAMRKERDEHIEDR